MTIKVGKEIGESSKRMPPCPKCGSNLYPRNGSNSYPTFLSFEHPNSETNKWRCSGCYKEFEAIFEK